MISLITVFLKMFFRNPRAMFFIIFLPAGIYLILGFLGLEEVIRFDSTVSYTEYLLPGIIAMALLQTGIYTVSYAMIDFQKSKILKRLSITPLSSSAFLWAQIFARFFIAVFQVGVLLLVGVLFFGTQIHGLFLLPFLIFCGSTLFLSVGFIISTFAKDYEEAAPFTMLFGLPLLFLGDVFFSIQNLPYSLTKLADFLPMRPLSSLMREVMLNLPAHNSVQDLLVLMGWLLVLLLLSERLFFKRSYK